MGYEQRATGPYSRNALPTAFFPNFYSFMGNSSIALSPEGRSVAFASRTSGMFGRGLIRLHDVSSGQEGGQGLGRG